MAKAKAERPGWKVAVIPDRMQLESVRAMVGSKRAVGSGRMEQRTSRCREPAGADTGVWAHG